MGPEQLEVHRAQRAPQPVAHRVRRERRDPLAARDRGRGLRRARRLGQHDPRARRPRRDRQAGTGCEPATAYRHDDRVESVRVDRRQQFERRGALARDHRRIGVRMHEVGTGLRLHPCAGGFARGDGGRTAVQGRPVGPDGRELGFHRAFGHHDVAGDAPGACGQRQRTPMVAGGMRDHAARSGDLVQRPDRVACATELERACALQRLRLQVEFAPGQRIERAAAQHGRDRGMGRDPRGCGQDVCEARLFRFHNDPHVGLSPNSMGEAEAAMVATGT